MRLQVATLLLAAFAVSAGARVSYAATSEEIDRGVDEARL
jgi:hypothetical protein